MSDLSPQPPEPAVMVEVTSSRSPLQAFSYNEPPNYVVNYANQQQHQTQPSDVIVESPKHEDSKGKSNNKSTSANASRAQFIKRNVPAVITQTVVPVSSNVGSSNKGQIIIGGYAHQAHQVVNATSCMTKVCTTVLKNVIAGARTTAANVNQNMTLTAKAKAPLAMTVIASKPPVATKLNPNTATYLLLAPVQPKNAGANNDGQANGQSPKHIWINLSKPQTFKIPSPVTGAPSNKTQTILLTPNRSTGKFGTLVQTRPFQSVSTVATATSTTAMSLSSISSVPRMVVPIRQMALNSNMTMRPQMFLNKAGNLLLGHTKMTTSPTIQFLNQTQLIPAQTRPSIQPMSQIVYSRPTAQYLSHQQPQHYVSVPPSSNSAYQQPSTAMTAFQHAQPVSPASPLQMAYQAQSTVNQKKRPLENTKSSPVKKKQPIASTSSPVLSSHEFPEEQHSPMETSFLPDTSFAPSPQSSTFSYEGSLEQMITQAYMNTLGRPLTEECMAQYHTPPGNWIYQRMFLSYQNVVAFKQTTVDLIKSKRKNELEDCAHEMYLNWLAVLVLRACYFSIPRNHKAVAESHGHVYRRRRIWFEPFGNETIQVRPVGEKITINTLLQSLDNFYEIVDSLNLTHIELALVSAFLLFSDPDVQDEPLTSKQLRNLYRDEIKHVMFKMATSSPKGLIRHMDLMFSLAEVVSVSACISFADCC